MRVQLGRAGFISGGFRLRQGLVGVMKTDGSQVEMEFGVRFASPRNDRVSMRDSYPSFFFFVFFVFFMSLF